MIRLILFYLTQQFFLTGKKSNIIEIGNARFTIFCFGKVDSYLGIDNIPLILAK